MHPQVLGRHPMLACGATCSQSDVRIVAVQALVGLMGEEDAETLKACWEALGKVSASVPKEVQPSHVRCVKEAVATAREKERRKRRPGPQLLPGFCLPKALAPVLPFYLQGVLQVRQSWARGFLCTDTCNERACVCTGFSCYELFCVDVTLYLLTMHGCTVLCNVCVCVWEWGA